MSWEAINATAQIISSFAVVASLWYLAIQVHRSTRVVKLTAQDAAASAVRDVTKQFSENAELGRIWRIGLEDINALSPDDRARFYHVTFQFLKAMETIHFYFIYGLMDEQIWRGWWNLYRHYLASPGLEHYWNVRQIPSKTLKCRTCDNPAPGMSRVSGLLEAVRRRNVA